MTMFATILVPTDFSECSRRAVETGLEVAARFDARRLVLVHASAHIDHGSFVDPEVLRTVDQVLEREQERLASMAREQMDSLLAQGEAAFPRDRVEYIIASGNPVSLILTTARDVAADLIVMGTHGRQGLSDHILGSTTERVQRRATCAVLTVKPDDFGFAEP